MRGDRLLIVLLIVVLAAGCARRESGKTTVRFWAMGNEGEMVRALIPEFERRHPDIRVLTQQIPWTAAHEKLLTAFAGGSMPDVAQLGNTWLPEFTVLDALEPLDTLVGRSGVVRRDDYFDGVWGTNVLDGVLRGIPWYVDTRIVYYRLDLLREMGYEAPPRTWEGVLKLCEAMQNDAKRRGVIRYPLFLPTNEWVPAIVLGVQSGGGFLKDHDTRGNFSGEDFRRAFGLLAEFYRKEYSPAGQSLITNMYNAFSDGLIAMYITGPWNVGEFRRRIPSSLQGAWMTAPLPSMDSTYPGPSLPLGTSLVLFRDSPRKEEAWKLIEFLASTEQSLAFYRVTGNLPPRKSAWQDSALAGNVYTRAFYSQLQRLSPLPQIPEWEQIVIKLQLYVEFIATGAMSADEALRRFDGEVDRILEKRRWLLQQRGLP